MTDQITIPRALLEQALNALTSFEQNYGSLWYSSYEPDQIDATCSSLRAELAKPSATPAWHDAPTCAGLWVCRQAITDNVQAYEVTDQVALNRNLKLKGQWYGPIPEDK